MNDEQGFLHAILAEPANNDLRLIYADWLEERCDPNELIKAEYLRLTVEVGDLLLELAPEKSRSSLAKLASLLGSTARGLFASSAQKKLNLQRSRFKEIAPLIDPEWRAVVSRLPVENCFNFVQTKPPLVANPGPFQFVCNYRWEDLQATESAGVRFCEHCEASVHYCATMTEAKVHAEYGHCVAVDLGLPRSAGDLEPRRITMGLMFPG